MTSEIDALYNSIFRELLTYMMEDPRMIGLCTHLLFGAKNFERIGDHATNIAENIHYLCPWPGRSREERPKKDTTSITIFESTERALMTASILIVEDEEPIQILLTYNLRGGGLPGALLPPMARTCRASSPRSAPISSCSTGCCPAFPASRSAACCARKPETRDIPIIMLTARGEETERVRGLATGADDYIVKPFSVPELMARIETILRRVNPDAVAETLKAGDIALDRRTRRVTRATRDITLSPTEFRLLEYLMQNPGRVYCRSQILDAVWGRDIYVDERTVDVHVGRLRKCLNRGREIDPIRTVRGMGYSFDERFGRSSSAA